MLFLALGFSHLQCLGGISDAWLGVDYGGRVFSGCACTLLSVRVPNKDLTNSSSSFIGTKIGAVHCTGCGGERRGNWNVCFCFKLFQCLISLSYQAPNLCLLFSQVPFPHFVQPCFVVLLELVDGVMQPLTLRHNFIESGIICFMHLDNLAFLSSDEAFEESSEIWSARHPHLTNKVSLAERHYQHCAPCHPLSDSWGSYKARSGVDQRFYLRMQSHHVCYGCQKGCVWWSTTRTVPIDRRCSGASQRRTHRTSWADTYPLLPEAMKPETLQSYLWKRVQRLVSKIHAPTHARARMQPSMQLQYRE